MVTIENWEEYAILRADGELDREGAAELDAFLAAHPELAEEAEMFDSLRLVPDEAVVFSGKDSLLKPEPRIVRFDRRWVYGVAAGMALLLGSLAVLRIGIEEGSGEAARVAGSVQLPVSKDNAPQSPAPVVPMETNGEQPILNSSVAKAASKRDERPRPVSAPSLNKESVVQLPKEAVPVVAEPEAPLNSTNDRLLAVTAPQEHRPESPAVPRSEPAPAPSVNSEESRGILDRLPIERERLVVLDDIRQTAADRIKSIRETREKIRNTDVTIALGRRDLFTLHF